MRRPTASPLLETKLYAPRLRRGLVPRPQPDASGWIAATRSKLTLVSAPAGLRQDDAARRVAGVARGRRAVRRRGSRSIRATTSPSRSGRYVIAALQTRGPGDRREGARRSSSRPAAADRDRPRAAAQRAQRGARRHRAGARRLPRRSTRREIQDGMAFLLEHLPAQVHLVITTRADPALPLARLRARGELVEIRAADLRFTPDEAAAYLNGRDGLGPDGAGCRGAGGPDRRLDRRAPAGGAVDAGARRHRRLHRRLRRGRPLHRRLPGRGGPAAPARDGPRPSCSRPRSSAG